MDVVAAVREGKGRVEWADLVSEHDGNRLVMRVFRDAMKFDGIRQPATAKQLQQIADMTGCMLLTPKLLDLIWIQAGQSGIRFDPVINHGGKIVANLTPEIVSPLIDAKIEAHLVENGPGKLIASVGKFWVLSNRLANPAALTFGKRTACNYGWPSSTAIYQGVTPGIKVWQSPGLRHDSSHFDSSQVIRLVARQVILTRKGSTESEEVDLHMIAQDKALAPLINHDGILRVLRQADVPEPKAVQNADGVWVLPELVIF